MPSIPWPLRYGFGLAVCIVFAVFPWVMTWLYSPLPSDLRFTATALSATRTARQVPKSTTNLVVKSETEIVQKTSSLTPTFTSSPTVTLAYTSTKLPTATSTPEISGIANETVNAYTCPGLLNKKGELEAGSLFIILGWDEVVERDGMVTYLLIENELGKSQKWIKDSEYLLLAVPDYREFIPHLACRR